ncbi:MAG TPA: TIGR04282 family arsenosugar biosynthesis glycosyltransferase [Actinomycetota bacterium]|nr:TIGR04282 family arsenosugar biosynthesis glycosyltransferase [Actinomycetota bacterium]
MRGHKLAVIAKEPVAGLAKTRLVPALGGRGAAAVAAALLDDTLSLLTRVEAERWLCFAPAAARDRMAALAPGFELLPQVDGDLGDRLAACAAALHAAGAKRLGIIGADTPHLPADWCRAAFELLDEVDVVLGPALDGGYYLIAIDGSAGPPPAELFTGVPMGSDQVLEETLRRARRLGLRAGLLPPLRDLDRVEDLRAALDGGELAASPRSLRVVGALLAQRDRASPHRSA